MKRSKQPFVVSEEWYLVSHRLPLAEGSQAAGFELAVAISMQMRYGRDGWNSYPGGATGNIDCGMY
jgi:hypothetical protein